MSLSLLILSEIARKYGFSVSRTGEIVHWGDVVQNLGLPLKFEDLTCMGL